MIILQLISVFANKSFIAYPSNYSSNINSNLLLSKILSGIKCFFKFGQFPTHGGGNSGSNPILLIHFI
jgi:hypothetical protein